MAKLKFGLGISSVFTAKEILEAAGLGKEYDDLAGHGLMIGGLNITSLDHQIRLPESADTLVILAPELDSAELEVEFTGEEPKPPAPEPAPEE